MGPLKLDQRRQRDLDAPDDHRSESGVNQAIGDANYQYDERTRGCWNDPRPELTDQPVVLQRRGGESGRLLSDAQKTAARNVQVAALRTRDHRMRGSLVSPVLPFLSGR